MLKSAKRASLVDNPRSLRGLGNTFHDSSLMPRFDGRDSRSK